MIVAVERQGHPVVGEFLGQGRPRHIGIVIVPRGEHRRMHEGEDVVDVWVGPGFRQVVLEPMQLVHVVTMIIIARIHARRIIGQEVKIVAVEP